MTRRRRGRPYQPLPPRTNRWWVVVVIVIALVFVVGFGILASIR